MGAMQDLTVIESLSIVVIRGAADSDSANECCEAYGMSGDNLVPPGILWVDYDCVDNFEVLIATDELEALREAIAEGGWEIVEVKPVTEPIRFGDGTGKVEILKHSDGWVVMSEDDFC